MVLTAKGWISLLVSSVFACFVFGKISSKAGYPRWHGLIMLVPILNFIAMLIFAYSEWPIETRVLELELRDPS